MPNHESEVNIGASPEDFSARGPIYNEEIALTMFAETTNLFPQGLSFRELEERSRQIEFASNSEVGDGGSNLEEHTVFSGVDVEKLGRRRQKEDQWEPFNTEQDPNNRFVLDYDGPRRDELEFNRDKVERLLTVAGIEGRIVVVNVPKDRSAPSVTLTGTNLDGSNTAGRFKSAENQPHVKSTPEGWKIEIPGDDIWDDLPRKKSNESFDQRFAKRFNQYLRDSVREIIFREKLILEPDMINYLVTFGTPALFLLRNEYSIVSTIEPTLAMYTMIGIYDHLRKRRTGEGLFRSRRNILETIFPPVEFDRYWRGIAFMKNKGRDLVRLKSEAKDLQ